MKMTIFCNGAPCDLVEVERTSRDINCRHHRGDDRLITLLMGTVSTSETSINFYQTIRRYVSEGSHLYTYSALRKLYNALKPKRERER
jgi:hypothetical protein